MILPVGGKRRQGRQIPMPKYLLLFKYSSEGAKGFLKEKAAPREAEIRKTFARYGWKSRSVLLGDWRRAQRRDRCGTARRRDSRGVYDGCRGNRSVRCGCLDGGALFKRTRPGSRRRRQPIVHPAADAFDVPMRRAARQRGLYVLLKPSAPERSGVCRLTPAISLSLCVHTGTDGKARVWSKPHHYD